MYSSKCASETRTQTLSSVSGSDYLWVSSNNIIYSPDDVGDDFYLSTATGSSYVACTWSPSDPTALNVDPQLVMMTTAATEDVSFLDPRPIAGGNSFDDVDTNPVDGFFDAVDYKGAFSATDLWLADWSWLSENGIIPDNIAGTVVSGGEITSATTWSLDNSPYLLTGQVTRPRCFFSLPTCRWCVLSPPRERECTSRNSHSEKWSLSRAGVCRGHDSDH